MILVMVTGMKTSSLGFHITVTSSKKAPKMDNACLFEKKEQLSKKNEALKEKITGEIKTCRSWKQLNFKNLERP